MGASFLAPKSGDRCQIGPRSAPDILHNLAITYECNVNYVTLDLTIKWDFPKVGFNPISLKLVRVLVET